MYSYSQMLKGIRNPQLIKKELIFSFNSRRNFDFALNGAYWTGNIGDRAIADSLTQKLSEAGKQTGLFQVGIGKTKSDVHVLGGGGVLRDCRAATDDNRPIHLKRRLDWVSKANTGAIVGVGVPGFKTGEARRLIRDRLSDVELITVRDRWSYEKLENYDIEDVHLTACPVFLLNDPEPEPSNQNHTGLNFRPWPNYPADIMAYYFGYEDKMNVNNAKQKYIENARKICREVNDPVFIPFHKEDEIFARENLNSLDLKILPYEESVETTLTRVSNVEQMVAMRYHSLIFSAITDTPVLAVGYQPKVSHLANRLNVRSYEPHGRIPLNFDSPKNVDDIKQSARRNINLLKEMAE